jgi:hypothetical protein
MKCSTTIAINQTEDRDNELNVEIDFYHQPREPMTFNYPGAAEEVSVEFVTVEGEKAPEWFLEMFEHELEDACWDYLRSLKVED